MTAGPSHKRPARYADSGVDIDAGNRLVDLIGPAVTRTRRTGSMGQIGGFGGLFDLKAAGYDDPVLVAATDGVGTKLAIAVETGRLDTIGIDLVAMCVNDLVVQGAEPLMFLDYYATGRLDPVAAAEVIGGIAEGCRLAGAALVGGETAEMPGLYGGADFDLAGFAVGAVERGAVLPKATIAAGDVVLGLASSGVHSNGFSLVRRIFVGAGLAYSDHVPFDNELSLGEALLVPTRIYVKAMLHAFETGAPINALAHITGGGLTENLPRALPDDLAAEIDLAALSLPPVLSWIRDLGAMEDEEFLRTFNAGVGMAVIVSPEFAEEAERTLASQGEKVRRIGRIIQRRDGPATRYAGRLEA